MKRTINNRKGITLTEIAISLVIIGIVGAGMSVQLGEIAEKNRAKNVGDHMRLVSIAAKQATTEAEAQIKADISGLAVGQTRTYPLFHTTPELVGYTWYSSLPNGTSHVSPANHDYRLVIKKLNTNNDFESMVITEPKTASAALDSTAIATAVLPLGGAGGAIVEGSTIKGVGGGWQAAQADWGNVGQQGSLASYLEFGLPSTGDVDLSKYLARASTGDAASNTMQTDLNLGGYSVNNAYDINASRNIFATEKVRGQTLESLGTAIIGYNANVGNNITATGRIRSNTYVEAPRTDLDFVCKRGNHTDCVSYEELKKVAKPTSTENVPFDLTGSGPVALHCNVTWNNHQAGKQFAPVTGYYVTMYYRTMQGENTSNMHVAGIKKYNAGALFDGSYTHTMQNPFVFYRIPSNPFSADIEKCVMQSNDGPGEYIYYYNMLVTRSDLP